DDFNRYLKAITAQSDSNDANLTNAYRALQTMVILTNNLSVAWSQFNGLLSGNPNANGISRAYDFIIRQTDDIDFNSRLLVTIIPSADLSPADSRMYRGAKSVQGVDLPRVPYVSIDGYT